MGKRAPADINMMGSAIGVVKPVDPVPAHPSVPQVIDSLQHSLATKGKHNGGITIGVFIPNGSSISFLVPVPPSVTHYRVSCLVAGAGELSIDSTSNATAKTFSFFGDEGADLINAGIYGTTTSTSATLPNSALRVRASAAWTWVSEYVTVVFATSTAVSGSPDGFIYGMVFDPIWKPEDV